VRSPASPDDSAGRETGQRFHQQIRAHGGQACPEFDGVLLRANLDSVFKSMSPVSEAGVDAHSGDAGARFAVEDGPLNGSSPAVLGQLATRAR